MKSSIEGKTYLFLLLSTTAWGFQPLTIKWLVAEWSPLAITVYRFILIGVILVAWTWHREGRRMLPDFKGLPLLCAMGLFNIGFSILQFTGLQYTTVTNCTVIGALSPALTAFLAAVFLHERLSRLAWGGIFLSLIGTLTVICHGSLADLVNLSFNPGDLLVFLAQLDWAAYTLTGGLVMKHLSPWAATSIVVLAGGIAGWFYGVFFANMHLTVLSSSALWCFGYTFLVGGLLAMLFWNMGVKGAGPSLAAIFMNLIPLVGAVSGVLFLGEQFGLVQLLGALGICGGVGLTTHSYEAADWIKRHYHLH